jgi:flavin reductase (DIM6/NTAB) family NADH-FMN oxidoreductase RutF
MTKVDHMAVRYSYEVKSGHGLRNNPLKAIIAPRPIGWISTRSRAGVANLAPYSFFNMINDDPPLVMFASTGYKDTVKNCDETREFGFNLATKKLADRMNESSAPISADVDEFDLCGLEKAGAKIISSPLVAASPASLECRVTEVRQLPVLENQLARAWITIGQVVAVHLDVACIVDGRFRTELANPILRAGYAAEYWEIDDAGRFSMPRPKGFAR